jgi:hypothetical protein
LASSCRSCPPRPSCCWQLSATRAVRRGYTNGCSPIDGLVSTLRTIIKGGGCGSATRSSRLYSCGRVSDGPFYTRSRSGGASCSCLWWRLVSQCTCCGLRHTGPGYKLKRPKARVCLKNSFPKLSVDTQVSKDISRTFSIAGRIASRNAPAKEFLSRCAHSIMRGST